MSLDSEDNIFIGICVAVVLFTFGLIGWSCYNQNIRGNRVVIDTAWTFNYADVYFPNGEKKTYEIEKWADAEGEQISIWTKDGNRLLVSSFNTILRDK